MKGEGGGSVLRDCWADHCSFYPGHLDKPVLSPSLSFLT